MHNNNAQDSQAGRDPPLLEERVSLEECNVPKNKRVIIARNKQKPHIQLLHHSLLLRWSMGSGSGCWLAGGEVVVRWATEPAGGAAITASGQKSSSAVVVLHVLGRKRKEEGKTTSPFFKNRKIIPQILSSHGTEDPWILCRL